MTISHLLRVKEKSTRLALHSKVGLSTIAMSGDWTARIVGLVASAFLRQCPHGTSLMPWDLNPTMIAEFGEMEKDRLSWHHKYGVITMRPNAMRMEIWNVAVGFKRP
jgi:hypothetical protein